MKQQKRKTFSASDASSLGAQLVGLRWAKSTQKERSEAARKASRARWDRVKDSKTSAADALN